MSNYQKIEAYLCGWIPTLICIVRYMGLNYTLYSPGNNCMPISVYAYIHINAIDIIR